MWTIAMSKVTRNEASMLQGNTLGSLLCPVLFALDLLVNRPDVIMIGEDQMPYAELYLKVCDRLKRTAAAPFSIGCLRGMDGERMKSSRPAFHLDPFDDHKQVQKKVAKAFCEPGNTDSNIILELAQSIIFPCRDQEIPLPIERSEEHGGQISVKSFDELQVLFSSGEIYPNDLKRMVVKEISEIFDPISSKFPEARRREMLASAFSSSKSL